MDARENFVAEVLSEMRAQGASDARFDEERFAVAYQRDADATPGRLRQLFWPDDAVRVADAPELLGVAEERRGERVVPLALRDDVLVDHVETFRPVHEAPSEVHHLFAARGDVHRGPHAVVAAPKAVAAAPHPVVEAGGSVALVAATLLIGSGVLTAAIVRRHG